MYLTKCPRCEEKTYEKADSHAYCVECGYSPDFDVSLQGNTGQPIQIPDWAIAALKESGLSEKEAKTSLLQLGGVL